MDAHTWRTSLTGPEVQALATWQDNYKSLTNSYTIMYMYGQKAFLCL